ncbi:PfkB family carbohydrate kinase [Streptomyces sp. NBC_00445]|uniref:PfkB family carbohydrate kinase n=1 Tax=unclassified Streptomyces TaxID=2593676 RepID=UPI002E214294|nr:MULTISPECIES: PfkB family carbohydrate kinase [unclassified Streptomyces]
MEEPGHGVRRICGGRVVVCGSLAFDEVFTVEGSLQLASDHLGPVRQSYVAFQAHTSFGGCAGNIGYALAGLNRNPIVVASVGNDAGSYAEHLIQHSIDISSVTEYADILTARCVVVTDLSGAQLVAFHPGAAGRYAPLPEVSSYTPLAIVAPSTTDSVIKQMIRLKQLGAPILWLPAHSVADYRDGQLHSLLRCSEYVIVNETEGQILCSMAQVSPTELAKQLKAYVVTLGERGSTLYSKGQSHHIAPVPTEAVDPTGCGDFYAAGFAHAVIAGLDLVSAAGVGSVMGALNASHKGTQTFEFRLDDVYTRFYQVYGYRLPSASVDADGGCELP